ncbi:MAG: hypothetical protein H6509_06510 [Bryobacterales bacterium]|nr:hypothetical protein [Acidobacteriota bacterium]MCB9384247.1 hypothetical protein [Bryobacterales bacterium]
MTRWAPAVCSFLLPGAGQFLQGRIKIALILAFVAGIAWVAVPLQAAILPAPYAAALGAPFLFLLHTVIAIEAYRWPDGRAGAGSNREVAYLALTAVAVSFLAFQWASPRSAAITKARELSAAGNCGGLNAFVANRQTQIAQVLARGSSAASEYRAEAAELERIRSGCTP